MKQASKEKAVDQILTDLVFCLEETGETSVDLAVARLQDIRAGCRLAGKLVGDLRERLVGRKGEE